jgi:hypothetical protein
MYMFVVMLTMDTNSKLHLTLSTYIENATVMIANDDKVDRLHHLPLWKRHNQAKKRILKMMMGILENHQQ